MTPTQILYVLSKASFREGSHLLVGGLVFPEEVYSLRWLDLEGIGDTAVDAVFDLFAKALTAGRLIPDDFQGYKKLTVYRVTGTTTGLTRSWLRVLCTSDFERIAFPFPTEVLDSMMPYVREFIISFRGSRNTAASVIQNLDLQT